jgi:hypothetical protein
MMIASDEVALYDDKNGRSHNNNQFLNFPYPSYSA